MYNWNCSSRVKGVTWETWPANRNVFSWSVGITFMFILSTTTNDFGANMYRWVGLWGSLLVLNTCKGSRGKKRLGSTAFRGGKRWSDLFVGLFLNWTPQEIVLLLLRYDASSSIINGTAQIPKDMTEDDEIITMLEGMRNWTFSPPFSQTCRSPCFTGSITVWFAQPQRGERHGGWRRNY